jgi:hypothetical protein
VLLVTDFMNLKIKPAQSFEGAHKDKMCVHACVYRGECSYIYVYLRLYCVSKKKSRKGVPLGINMIM